MPHSLALVRRILFLALLTLFLAASPPVTAQYLPGAAPEKFEFFPGAQYDARIPTLEHVVGHSFGDTVSSHAEIERYLAALAQAAPARLRVTKYAQTWEGRALYYAVLGSEANIARLDEIKRGMNRLADPRGLSDADAEKLMASLPPIVWLTCNVHGNEASGGDAGLFLLYHLLAAQNDEVVKQILDRAIVVVDPTENPDGRDRFVNYFRQTRGRWADPSGAAAEHNEVWPGGRANHYLFDMNRDWFALTQPETRGRVVAYLEWNPVVFADLHEMGGNGTYYFAPPAQPWNPNMTKAQEQWLFKIGRNIGDWFDRMRFDYFTREVYDSFYPGYGEGWPMYSGSIGMTFEQASVRGVELMRSDKTLLRYRDAVQHHFIAGLATAQATARNARELIKYFYDYRRSGASEGQNETVKEYIIPPGRDPNRAAKLAALLMQQGIEVKRAEKPFTNPRVRDYYDSAPQSKEFPAGTFVISMAQPNKRLAKTLLDKHTPMDNAFIEEQLRRRKRRLGDQIYDVTAWSLPLLYDVEAYMAEAASSGPAMIKDALKPQGKLTGGTAHVAYLIPWGTRSAARAAADFLMQKVRMYRATRSFTLGETKFPAGTLVIKTKDNPADLHARIEKAVADYGADVQATSSTWIEEGASLGSGSVRFVEPPRVALAWNDPTSSLSAGWARFVLEQQYGVRVTVVRTQQLRFADLSQFNVLILPHAFGGYGNVLGDGAPIKQWVLQGGTLIAIGDAIRWLTEERVALLATSREYRSGKPEVERKEEPRPSGGAAGATPASAGAAQPSGGAAQRPPDAPPSDAAAKSDADFEKMIQPEREFPDATPGAIFRVRINSDHWLGFGYDKANVMVESANIFTPLKIDKGENVGVFEPTDKAPLSGFTWDDTRRQMANKAYLMHARSGRGNVVAFSEDPNFRAFADGLNVLFLNAVLFGPSM